MRQAYGGRLTIERIEKKTDELLKKNQELVEKWKAQYRQDVESIRTQRNQRVAQTEGVSTSAYRCSAPKSF
jgi:hypothetical protein